MAKSLITQTLGGPSHDVLGLIEISDKIARLSEAGHAFETKRRHGAHPTSNVPSKKHRKPRSSIRPRHSIFFAIPMRPLWPSRAFPWASLPHSSGMPARG